jgi:hypothetical protein
MSNITGNINEFKLNEIFELVKYYHISNPIQTHYNPNPIIKSIPIQLIQEKICINLISTQT